MELLCLSWCVKSKIQENSVLKLFLILNARKWIRILIYWIVEKELSFKCWIVIHYILID